MTDVSLFLKTSIASQMIDLTSYSYRFKAPNHIKISNRHKNMHQNYVNSREYKIILIVADVPWQLKEIAGQRCAMGRFEVQ